MPDTPARRFVPVASVPVSIPVVVRARPSAGTADTSTAVAPAAVAASTVATASAAAARQADDACACGCGTAPIALAPEPAEPMRADGTAWFRIPAMDCAVEEAEIRRVLDGMAGIDALEFRLAARTLGIRARGDALAQALDAIRRLGYEAQALAPAGARGGRAATGSDRGFARGHAHDHAPHDHAHDDGHDHRYAHDDHAAGHDDAETARAFVRPGLALVGAFAAEALHFFLPAAPGAEVAGMALAALAIGLAGLDTYRKGWAALRRARLNINALMAVAVTGAFAIGQWPEAAMVMALYAIAELIEARSVDRARNAIRGLMALAPAETERRAPDGGWQRVAAAEVRPGEVVRVKPGARVPLDGVVTAGASAVNQAPVTGESIPVDKAPGDPLYAGSINESATLELRATAAADDSTLARIIHAVEQAQGKRAPTQRFVDRFAAVYTPAVFAIALAVALLGPLAFGWGWVQAVYKALVLLVIACPCALVISTPVTVVSALAAAARRGILIKGGSYLEEARRLRAIAFDKTGTITEGKPRLVEFSPLGDTARADVLRIAHALAAHSDHPVSQAIAAGLEKEAAAQPASAGAAPLAGFTALPGRGVAATLDGASYLLGNHRLIEDRGLCSPALEARLAEHEAQGRSITLLASGTAVLALFAVADTPRPAARAAVAELAALGVRAVMLTGDNPSTAQAIGRAAGIADARGNLLPQDKLAAIAALQREHGPTAMCGDGINDAPALARADIGIALGGAGTDIAMEAADIVVMNDDLRRIPETVRLSRRAHAVLWQNIALALGIKAVFMALALAGEATMWMAVFADMGASLIVVGNGLRLLRARRGG